MIEDVSFDLHEGEVLGVTGLVGSGFEDIPYFMFGARPADSGTLLLGDRERRLRAMTPQAAMGARMAFVPADRQRDGSLPSLSIGDNMSVLVLDRYFETLRLRRRRMKTEMRELMHRFDVRPPDPDPPYSSLSGGNQQKALLAKWFEHAPRILLLHEPTQGVDVGAREQIFSVIRSAAETGTAVVCASADYEQLERVCQRVLVIGRGRVSRILEGSDVTKDRIAEQCYDSMSLGSALEAPAFADEAGTHHAAEATERQRPSNGGTE
jgi:ribose transport system ATP-binding protein